MEKAQARSIRCKARAKETTDLLKKVEKSSQRTLKKIAELYMYLPMVNEKNVSHVKVMNPRFKKNSRWIN